MRGRPASVSRSEDADSPEAAEPNPSACDRAEGYVLDVPYTAGYHRELSPSLQQFVLWQQGIATSHAPGEGFDYFELGFGQGLSLNVHALTHPAGRFRGNDINPEHVAFAQSLANAGGSSIDVSGDSFKQLLGRDLPGFDYISLHGVWSWVSERNRTAIVEFLRRRLKPGGVAMVSYNALPGLAATMPLRHLISEHARQAGGSGSPLEGRISDALAFAQKLRDGGAHYFGINANAASLLTSLEAQNPRYLAHEYFNRDWTPMYFSEVARCLSDAGLAFAGSVSPFGSIPGVALSPEMNAVLDGIASMEFREDLRDFMLNTKFRRDLFVRGARRITDSESEGLANGMCFALIGPPKNLDGTLTIGMREVKLHREIFEPVVDTLRTRAGSMSLAELQAHEVTGKLAPEHLLRVLTVLAGMNCVAIHAGGEVSLERVRSLNRHLAGNARDGSPVAYLVSAGAGTAISADRFEQLFLLEAGRGGDADQAAGEAWKLLKSRGETISLDGWPLVEEADILNELRGRAARFYRDRLPRFRDLGVIV